MNSNQPLDPEESFALDAYGALPQSQPPGLLDARILAAAHAANARVSRSPRRWTTGLATAAVAVLAVGIAWRSMDTRTPALPVSNEPAAPRMQPAFKTESAAPVRDETAKTGSNERDRQSEPASGIPAAAPTLSAAEWDTLDAAQEQKRNASAAAQSAKVPSRDSEQVNRETDGVAPPEPFPAARQEQGPVSTAAESARLETPTQSISAPSPIPIPEMPPDVDEQIVAPALAQPEPAPSAQQPDSPERSGAREESPSFGSARTASESSTIASGASVPAAVARPRDQAAPGVSGIVSPQSIHAGTTPLRDAVAAVRAAHARGDPAETRRLAKAIVARFGSASLPEDLREHVL